MDTAAHVVAAVGDDRLAQGRIELRQLRIHGRLDRGHAAVLLDGDVGAARGVGDLLPDLRRAAHRTTLDGVDDDVLAPGAAAGVEVLHIILVVHVRRGVADQEDEPQNVLSFAPGDLVNGLMQGLVDGLRPVTAAVRREARELGVDCVHVVGQVEDRGDVVIAAIAIGE